MHGAVQIKVVCAAIYAVHKHFKHGEANAPSFSLKNYIGDNFCCVVEFTVALKWDSM